MLAASLQDRTPPAADSARRPILSGLQSITMNMGKSLQKRAEMFFLSLNSSEGCQAVQTHIF
jgi:hypothetical protein